MKISQMRGFGPKSVERLTSVGIETSDQLEELGAIKTYQIMKDAFPKWTSLNLLWGLQAALMEIDLRELPDEIKDNLLAELENEALN